MPIGLRSWEDAAGTLPWETSNAPIYNRTVTISRPNVDVNVGTQPYSGTTEINETVIYPNIPAAIQLKSAGRILLTNLPSDARHQVEYVVNLQSASAPFGTVQITDIITDDLGIRYQAFAATWTVFGYELSLTLLEV